MVQIQPRTSVFTGIKRAHGDCATRIWLLLDFAKKRAVVDRSCSNCSWTDCLILDYLWPHTIFSWEPTKLVCTGSRLLGESSGEGCLQLETAISSGEDAPMLRPTGP